MIRFVIPGTPISKLRHRTFVTPQGHQRQYSPPELVLYENMVALVAREAMTNGSHQERITGPVKLAARFYFGVARTRAGKLAEGAAHTQRPDLDNCIKSIKDGLNGVAWNDDCCVAELTASKHWTHLAPRAEVEIESL